MLREDDDVFNGEFSLENMTPVSRADWIVNQIYLSKYDISYESVKHALSLGVTWADDDDNHHFYTAAKNGHTELFRPLQKSGLDINDLNFPPISGAARYCHTQSLQELLSIGAKVILKNPASGEIMNALGESCAALDFEGVKILVEALKKQEPKDFTRYINHALCNRVFDDIPLEWRKDETGTIKYNIIKHLLDNGADPQSIVTKTHVMGEKEQISLLDICKWYDNQPLVDLVQERIKQKSGNPVVAKDVAPRTRLPSSLPRPS